MHPPALRPGLQAIDSRACQARRGPSTILNAISQTASSVKAALSQCMPSFVFIAREVASQTSRRPLVMHAAGAPEAGGSLRKKPPTADNREIFERPRGTSLPSPPARRPPCAHTFTQAREHAVAGLLRVVGTWRPRRRIEGPWSRSGRPWASASATCRTMWIRRKSTECVPVSTSRRGSEGGERGLVRIGPPGAAQVVGHGTHPPNPPRRGGGAGLVTWASLKMERIVLLPPMRPR